MSWSFVAKATAVPNGTTNWVISVPAGTANGDFLVLQLQGFNSAAAITPPAGWNTLVNTASWDGHSDIYYLGWRVANSEPASYTFTAAAGWPAIIMCAYRSSTGGSSFVQHPANLTNTAFTNASEPAPAISGFTTGDLVIYGWAGCNTGKSGTNTLVLPAPSNLLASSSTGDINNSTGGADGGMIACTNGTAPGSATSGATMDYNDFAIEIAPAVTAGSAPRVISQYAGFF